MKLSELVPEIHCLLCFPDCCSFYMDRSIAGSCLIKNYHVPFTVAIVQAHTLCDDTHKGTRKYVIMFIVFPQIWGPCTCN